MHRDGEQFQKYNWLVKRKIILADFDNHDKGILDNCRFFIGNMQVLCKASGSVSVLKINWFSKPLG